MVRGVDCFERRLEGLLVRLVGGLHLCPCPGYWTLHAVVSPNPRNHTAVGNPAESSPASPHDWKWPFPKAVARPSHSSPSVRGPLHPEFLRYLYLCRNQRNLDILNPHCQYRECNVLSPTCAAEPRAQFFVANDRKYIHDIETPLEKDSEATFRCRRRDGPD